MGGRLRNLLVQHVVPYIVFPVGRRRPAAAPPVSCERRRRIFVGAHLRVRSVPPDSWDSSADAFHLLGAVRDLLPRSLPRGGKVDRSGWCRDLICALFSFWSLHRLFPRHRITGLRPCGSRHTTSQVAAESIAGIGRSSNWARGRAVADHLALRRVL